MNHFYNQDLTENSEKMKILKLPDCIHLTENGRCDILRVKACQGDGCSFCESDRKNKITHESWQKHLCSIGEDAQSKIAAVYYGGKMPWKINKEAIK